MVQSTGKMRATSLQVLCVKYGYRSHPEVISRACFYMLSWGALNFVHIGVQPEFPKCGACELIFASSNKGTWQLKFGQKWRLKFPIFSQNGLVNWLLSFCLKWNPCEVRERHEKGYLGLHIPIPHSRSIPASGIFSHRTQGPARLETLMSSWKSTGFPI